MALKVGELYGELNLDRSGFTKGLKQSHTDFASAGEGLLGAAGKLAAGLGAAIGGAALVKKIAEIGIGFQDMGNTLHAVTGASTADMDRVGKKAIELGNDLSLPTTSATDAEQAMLELAKGGLSVQEAMDAAKGTLQLSTAATVDVGQAAIFTADALNTFHLKGNQAGMVADLLAGAANASSGEITDMAQSLQQAGSVFAAAHVPIQSVVTMISELAQNGIRGSDAGTSLKTMMLALQTPTSQQAGLMKQLNLNLYDSHGAMRDFRAIIGDAQGPLAKLTQAERDHALGVIFGSDAVRAANIIFGQGTKGFDEMRAAVTKQGTAAEVAAAKSQGLGGALRGLQSQAETLGLQIFQQVSPALEGMARELSNDLPKAIDVAGQVLGGLRDKVNEAGKVAGPAANEYSAQWAKAAKDSKPELARMGQDFSDLGKSMQGLVKSEAFASAVAAFTVILPAAMKPTIATLELMIDQFRVTTTALFGFVKVTWDVMHGDFKSAWKDAAETVKNENENMDREARDGSALQKAIAAATGEDVVREYERMKQQTLNATAGMKDELVNNAAQTRIDMGIQARATGTEYSGGMADGLRATGPLVVDAAAAVTKDAVAKAHDAASGAHEVGAFIAQGIALGLADNQGFVSAAAAAVARNAVRDAKGPQGAMASSPSQLSKREVGLPLAQGVAAGIMAGYGHVAEAAKGLVKPFASGIGTPAMAAMAMSVATQPSQAPAPAGRAVHVTQNFYGSTADHRQMFADAAWEARRLR